MELLDFTRINLIISFSDILEKLQNQQILASDKRLILMEKITEIVEKEVDKLIGEL